MRKSVWMCLENTVRDTMVLFGKIQAISSMHWILRWIKCINEMLLVTLLVVPLCVTQADGATLSVVMSGSGQGSVNSSPPGIACPGSCSGAFTTFILYPNPATNSFFSGWGGACAGMENCSLTLSGDKTVNALFELKTSQLHVSGTNYGALQVAYNSVAPEGKVMVVAKDQAGDLILDNAINFTLEGGFDDAFSSNDGNTTRLHGKLTIKEGSLKLSHIAVAPSVPAPPSAPSDVTATAGDGQAIINWGTVLGATSYNLYYATSTGVTRANGTKVSGVSSGQTVTGLTNDTVYYFVVTALDTNGESIESSQVMIKPVHSAPPAVPAAPAGVFASAGNGKVDLSWNTVKDATSYTIYWSTSPDVTRAGGTKIANITKSPYQHANLTNGISYYYIVTASNGTGESAPSDEVSAQPTIEYYAKIANIAVFNTGGLMMSYTTYEYDDSGRVQKLTNYGSTGVISNYFLYEYDAAGRVVKLSTHTYGGQDSFYLYTTTEYNAAGKPYRISNYVFAGTYTYLSTYTLIEYDTAGNMTKSSSINGLSGLVLSYVTYDYNAAGSVTKQTNYDASGMTGYTTTDYNEAGKVEKVATFDRNSDNTQYVITEYNEAGKESKITTYNGYANFMTDFTTYDYDDAGNRIKTSKYDFASLLTGYTTVEYNAAKMPTVLSVYGPTGLLKTRMINSYIAIGSMAKESTYDPTDKLTGYVTNDYNGVGKISMASSFDASGLLLKYVMTDYDESLRVAKVSTFDANGLKEYSMNEYDEAGRLITVSTYGPDDVLTKSTTKLYNEAGYVTRETSFDAAGAITGYIANTYNTIGKVLKASSYTAADALSKYTVNDYDAQGRKIKISKYDAADKLTEYTSTEYNVVGKQIKNTTYDGTGQLKSYTTYEYGH
jgi:hypothetical protein